MPDRTAVDTIRGYFYQFDYTIESILKLVNEEDSITVENIEDLDIKDATEITAVQCKYYEKTEYNHSVIADPIRFMLKHFNEVKLGIKPAIKYKLYGYYKSDHAKLSLPLTLQDLKVHFLTYSRTEKVNNLPTKKRHELHVELGLDDTDLTKFLELLEIDIHAKEFEKQYKEIIHLFKYEFKCTEFTAEYFFYNSALRVIRDLSKDSNVLNRKITKKEFLVKVNNSKILFNEWFVQLKGEKMHFANLRKEYFSSFNILYKERFFLFDISSGSYTRTDIIDLLNLVIKNFTKIINQPNAFCPYVYLRGIEDSELIEIKNDLIANEIIIKDGFDFEGSKFNPNLLVIKPNINYPIKLKFINKLEYLNEVLLITKRKSEIYQFYTDDIFYTNTDNSIKKVDIQIKEIINVKNII